MPAAARSASMRRRNGSAPANRAMPGSAPPRPRGVDPGRSEAPSDSAARPGPEPEHPAGQLGGPAQPVQGRVRIARAQGDKCPQPGGPGHPCRCHARPPRRAGGPPVPGGRHVALVQHQRRSSATSRVRWTSSAAVGGRSRARRSPRPARRARARVARAIRAVNTASPVPEDPRRPRHCWCGARRRPTHPDRRKARPSPHALGLDPHQLVVDQRQRQPCVELRLLPVASGQQRAVMSPGRACAVLDRCPSRMPTRRSAIAALERPA